MQNRIWPAFMVEPEYALEIEAEERDRLFREWEDREANRENGEKEAA